MSIKDISAVDKIKLGTYGILFTVVGVFGMRTLNTQDKIIDKLDNVVNVVSAHTENIKDIKSDIKDIKYYQQQSFFEKQRGQESQADKDANSFGSAVDYNIVSKEPKP